MNYFKGLAKIPSFDGKYKVLFRRDGARTIEQLEDFTTFLTGDSAKKGGKLFMFFEPEVQHVYDSKGNIKRNKKGEPILHGSSDAKNAARAMAKLAKQHGLDARVNTSGMLVFANPNRTVINRAVVRIEKDKRPQRKPLPKALKTKIKNWKRGGKKPNGAASVPTTPPKKKGLISLLLGR